jgi:hypothetical protein
MGAHENQILQTIEHLTFDAGQALTEIFEQVGQSARAEESPAVPTGLMSIYVGCADVW